MLRIVQIWIVFLTLAVLTKAYAADLTQESVKQIIANVDDAVNTFNVQKMADVLSNDVKIIMNINVQGRTQVLNPSKQEYLTMLQQSWMEYENYEYSRSNLAINIQGGKASVTADVKESITIQGRVINGQSKEEVVIELVNGKPLITKVTGYTSM